MSTDASHFETERTPILIIGINFVIGYQTMTLFFILESKFQFESK